MTLFDIRFKTNIIMDLVSPLNQIDIIFNYNLINKNFPKGLKQISVIFYLLFHFAFIIIIIAIFIINYTLVKVINNNKNIILY